MLPLDDPPGPSAIILGELGIISLHQFFAVLAAILSHVALIEARGLFTFYKLLVVTRKGSNIHVLSLPLISREKPARGAIVL